MKNVTGGKTPDFGSRTYTEIMKEQLLKGEEVEVRLIFVISLIYSLYSQHYYRDDIIFCKILFISFY